MILNVYAGTAQGVALATAAKAAKGRGMGHYSTPTVATSPRLLVNRTWAGYPSRATFGIGLGDVNTDAQALLASKGIAANCKFVPYQGPFGGGTNVCDVEGDTAGYQYGAELLMKPGGIDIMQTEIASAAANIAALRADAAKATALQLQQQAAANSGYVPAGNTTYTGPQQPVPQSPAAGQQAGQQTAVSTAAPTGAAQGKAVITSNGIPSTGISQLDELPMWGKLALLVAGGFVVGKLVGK